MHKQYYVEPNVEPSRVPHGDHPSEKTIMDHCVDSVLHESHVLPSVMESQDKEDKSQGKKSKEEDQNEVEEDVPNCKNYEKNHCWCQQIS